MGFPATTGALVAVGTVVKKNQRLILACNIFYEQSDPM